MKSRVYYQEAIDANGKRKTSNKTLSRKWHLLMMAEKNGWKREWLEHLPTKVLTTFAGKDIRELHKKNNRPDKKDNNGVPFTVTVANLLKKYTPIFNRR